MSGSCKVALTGRRFFWASRLSLFTKCAFLALGGGGIHLFAKVFKDGLKLQEILV